MKKLLLTAITLGAVHASNALDSKVTYVPSGSGSSFDEAREGCYQPSQVTGLAAGRPVGRGITATGPYIAVCERRDENGALTYVPTASGLSYDDARENCYRPSQATGLSAGRPVGQVISSRGPYLVVCERPIQ